MQCEYQKTQNSMQISEPLKKFQMEGGCWVPLYLKSSRYTGCKSCHSCKYLMASWMRGLLGSTRWKAVMLLPPYVPDLTTSMTRGLLGSTRRKAVMFVPPYVPDHLLDKRVVGVYKAEGGDVGAAICT